MVAAISSVAAATVWMLPVDWIEADAALLDCDDERSLLRAAISSTAWPIGPAVAVRSRALERISPSIVSI